MNANVHDWHNRINPELREHLIQKLTQAILLNNQAPVGQAPDNNQHAEDAIIHNPEMYATAVENNVFETAMSRREYFHLLAVRYYHIQQGIYE